MKVEEYWSHSFLPELVRPDGVVFDFGLNDGGFARLVAPLCRTVVGFEPDPTWAGRHDVPDNVRVVPCAVAAKAGTMSFHVNRALCSSMHYAEPDAVAVDVEAVTLEGALAMEPDGRIDLIKMDIEGEEIDVLRTTPAAVLSRVAQMTVEFHDFLEPARLPDIRSVIARLNQIGFYSVCFSFRTYGDTLFVNRHLVHLSWWHRVWLVARFKFLRGFGRLARRLVRA